MKSGSVFHHFKPWIVMSGMFILMVLICLDYTAVNVALVTISEEMSADLNEVQWLLSGYILAWSACVVPAGQLADIYGKRRLLLYGIWFFLVSSLLCGCAPTIEILIMGRVLQGIGGALMGPPIYVIVFSVFPPRRRGFAVGLLGISASVGLAIGPSFGGLMVEYFRWSWIFYMNIPFCLMVLALILWSFDKEPRRLSKQPFDVWGSLLMGTSLALSMFALNQTEIWGFASLRLWGTFALGIFLGFIFIQYQKKQRNPLIPNFLFKNKSYVGCLIAYSITGAMFSGVLVIMGLYLQNPMGYTAYNSGFVFLAMTVALGALSPFGGTLTDKMDPRVPICLGVGLGTVAAFYAMTLDLQSSVFDILWMLFLFGVSLGLSFPSLNATMLRVIDPSILNTGSAFFNMVGNLGEAIGVIGGTSLLVGLGIPYAHELLQQKGIHMNQAHRSALNDYLSQAHPDSSLLKVFQDLDVDHAIQIANYAFIGAKNKIMLILVLLGLFATFISFFWIQVGRTPPSTPEKSIQGDKRELSS